MRLVASIHVHYQHGLLLVCYSMVRGRHVYHASQHFHVASIAALSYTVMLSNTKPGISPSII